MSIDNHLSEEQIAQCADAIVGGRYGELDSELRNHLTICDDCAAEVLSVTDIVIDFKANASKGKLIRFKPWVAAVSGVAAVGLIFFVAMALLKQNPNTQNLAENEYKFPAVGVVDSAELIGSPTEEVESLANLEKPEDKSDVVSPKSAPKQKETPMKSKPVDSFSGGSYVPDQTLEILFENFTQAYRGEDIVILSSGVTELPGTDSLKWSNPSKEELYVEFFDNTGNRFLTLTERSSGISIPDLNNGLYYWKLINQDFDLLFVGKIVVK